MCHLRKQRHLGSSLAQMCFRLLLLCMFFLRKMFWRVVCQVKSLGDLLEKVNTTRLRIYCVYLHYLFVCTVRGCVSHPDGTLVSGVRGRHGHGAAAPLGHAGALEHAGVEVCVSAGVFRQVVAPHEALVTQGAVEALLARVRAVVAR